MYYWKMDKESLRPYIEDLKKGNMNAFGPIFEVTKKGVFLSAYTILGKKEDAEDVVNETFLTPIKSKPALERPRKSNSPTTGRNINSPI